MFDIPVYKYTTFACQFIIWQTLMMFNVANHSSAIFCVDLHSSLSGIYQGWTWKLGACPLIWLYCCTLPLAEHRSCDPLQLHLHLLDPHLTTARLWASHCALGFYYLDEWHKGTFVCWLNIHVFSLQKYLGSSPIFNRIICLFISALKDFFI